MSARGSCISVDWETEDREKAGRKMNRRHLSGLCQENAIRELLFSI